MIGLTVVQGRQLLEWTQNLWVILDQEDFEKIAEIYKNAIDREEELAESEE